jgi:hypothetical protein
MARVFVVVLFLAIAVPFVSAQRHGGGGGHVGMGGSVSFGAHGGFNSGPHFGGRGFAGRGFVGHGFVGHGFVGHGFVGHGFVGHRPFFPGRRFHSNRFFFGFPGIFGYPFYGYPYYDTLGYDSSDSATYASSQYQQQLSQQMYDLSTQVRDLRDQNDQLRYDLERRRYRGDDQPQPSPTPQSSQTNPTTHEAPSTVLVFSDGHRLEVRSYAVVGQTLWILSPKHAQKVALSQLNLDETKKLNAERGLEFDVPTNN